MRVTHGMLTEATLRNLNAIAERLGLRQQQFENAHTLPITRHEEIVRTCQSHDPFTDLSLKRGGRLSALVGFPNHREDNRILVLNSVVDLPHQGSDTVVVFFCRRDVAGDFRCANDLPDCVSHW